MEIELDDTVACDFCNFGEDTLGGGLIGSYAVCGDCLDAVKYKNEITKIFDKTKTFRENVLQFRKETYGTTEAFIKVTSWDEPPFFEDKDR